MYHLYHIKNEKIGVTMNPTIRVEKQQGYKKGEYEILATSDDIHYISKLERQMQYKYGYPVDRDLYSHVINKNKKNKSNNMRLNVTDQTTTFPCPTHKLKGQLYDNVGLEFSTRYGDYTLDEHTIMWIMKNVKPSMFNDNRCFIYNKALYESKIKVNEPVNVSYEIKEERNPQIQIEKFFEEIRASLAAKAAKEAKNNKKAERPSTIIFDDIREWASARGIYQKGDSKTQYVKLMEEAGELAQAILKKDTPEIKDAIGDMVVVLTNLAHLEGLSIEQCIGSAYDVISKRHGQMINGTFVKSEL